jgi:hypothetical protein
VPTTLRSETASLVRLAERDLARLWRLVAQGASAEVALRDLLPAIVSEYGAAGAAMAAEWYDQQREKVDAKGRFVALPVAADDRGSQALIGWALAEAKDDTSLATLIAGGVQRRIADHARYTVANNAVEDKAARGWQRVGAGECAFCRAMIAKGAVYTESSVKFGSHDHCNCSVAPAWGGEPAPVDPYKPSLRFRSDEARAAHNKRTREWIAENN